MANYKDALFYRLYILDQSQCRVQFLLHYI